MNFAQYKKVLKIYMDKYDLPIMKAINDMDIDTAEKILSKIHIYEYMELYGVSYTSAVHLMAIDEISNEYNISMS